MSGMQLKCVGDTTSQAHVIAQREKSRNKEMLTLGQTDINWCMLEKKAYTLESVTSRHLSQEAPFHDHHHPFEANISLLDNPDGLPARLARPTTIELVLCGSKHGDCEITSQSSSRPTTC